MQIEITSYVYREKYPFGKFIHDILCRVLGESYVFLNGLAIEEEIEIDVAGYYTPGNPGNPSWDPDEYDPPTQEEIEDIRATHNGQPFELTAEEKDQLTEKLLEAGRDKRDESFEPPDFDDYDDYDRDCDYWSRIQ